ncbi:MAG: tyrosine-protein phosphatase [Steroidobacteraceae bacterium]|jgi:protein-tyrosine phosphatase|nr:tyrosine-protein phosphatase [Steroidobacteraceae bacterium]
MNDTTAGPSMRPPGAAVPERVLPLEGVRNFRDLGGYETLDGRRVRWRRIFRSASLGSLTPRDHAQLEGLGLRVVFDLRATDERAQEPVRWSSGRGPRLLDHDYVLDLSALSQVLPRPDADVAAARGAFIRLYEGLPAHFAAAYRALFAALLRHEAPLAFNCSAGKDRTGVGAALLLAALGVPRDTLVADYLLSNEHYRPGPEAAAAMSRRHGEWLRALRPEMLQVMLSVDASYLEAAFAAIERQHGSVDHYLESALGIDRRARDALRQLYTEP